MLRPPNNKNPTAESGATAETWLLWFIVGIALTVSYKTGEALIRRYDHDTAILTYLPRFAQHVQVEAALFALLAAIPVTAAILGALIAVTLPCVALRDWYRNRRHDWIED
jgi:hypothetical protein